MVLRNVNLFLLFFFVEFPDISAFYHPDIGNRNDAIIQVLLISLTSGGYAASFSEWTLSDFAGGCRLPSVQNSYTEVVRS